MKSLDGDAKFEHIPDWYNWQRECVKREIEDGTYRSEFPVDICMTVDTKHLYHVGEGIFLHTGEGFRLVGCDGKRLFSFSLPQQSLKCLSDITETYLLTQLERGFFTLDFYKSLCITEHKET